MVLVDSYKPNTRTLAENTGNLASIYLSCLKVCDSFYKHLDSCFDSDIVTGHAFSLRTWLWKMVAIFYEIGRNRCLLFALKKRETMIKKITWDHVLKICKIRKLLSDKFPTIQKSTRVVPDAKIFKFLGISSINKMIMIKWSQMKISHNMIRLKGCVFYMYKTGHNCIIERQKPPTNCFTSRK